MSANQQKPKSGAPLMIIGVVLVIVVLIGIYFYSASGPSTNTAGNRAATPAAGQKSQIPANAPVGAQPPNLLGSPTAPVTIEEFADFQCPMCGTMHPIMKNIQAQYGSRIKFIYRHFPLTQIHKNSYDAAVAAEAAGLQDRNKFWEMQNLIFTNQAAWSNSNDAKGMFKEYAAKIGLDVAKWENDMLGMPAKSRVDADIARGKGVNLTSTPTIYINGVPLTQSQFSIEAIKQVVDAELAKANPQQPAPAQPEGNTNK